MDQSNLTMNIMDHRRLPNRKPKLTVEQLENLKRHHIEIDTSKYDIPLEKKSAKEAWEHARTKGWVYRQKFHGDEFLKGFPDELWGHPLYGARLVETKSFRNGHKLSHSQVQHFARLESAGIGVWVIHGPGDIDKLQHKPNWREYIP